MKAEKIEKYQSRYREAVQEKLGGEEVLAVGLFHRTGSYGAMALEQVSGLASMAASALGKKKAGGMPQNLILAVTAQRLHAFGYSPKGTKIKVKDEEAVWDRSDVQLSTEGKSLTQRITISSPTEGEKVELDTSKLGGPDFNRELYDLLGSA